MDHQSSPPFPRWMLLGLVIAMLAVGVGAVITHMWLLMVGIMLALMAMVMTLRQRSVRPRI